MQLVWPEHGTVLLVGPETVAFDQAKKIFAQGSKQSQILFATGNHLDFCYVHPEKDSHWIKIDQVRDLITWVTGRPQIASKKVVIISPAHAMNVQAANALLKTLEESPFETLFILVTDKPSLLPATIRSRCFTIRIKTPIFLDPKLLLLKEGMVNDLNNLRSKKSYLVTVSAAWIKEDPKIILNCFLVILNEKMARLAQDGHVIKNRCWWQFLANVFNARRILEETNQPNVQLLIESLLIEYLTIK